MSKVTVRGDRKTSSRSSDSAAVPAKRGSNAPGSSAGRAVTLGVRPEHLGVSTTSGEWPAKVRLAEHLGSDTFVYAEADGGGPMTVRVEGEAAYRPGEPVYLTPQEDRLHKFDKDGKRID